MKKIGKVMVIISLVLIIFGGTCLVLSKREQKQERYYMRNCYGDTIEVTVYNGEICDYYYGTPLLYCDRCHGIMNGRGCYGWNDLTLCEDCQDYFWQKYKADNS